MLKHLGLWIDLPVAALLLFSWLTIPAAALHIVLGVLFTVAATAHLVIKRRQLHVLRTAARLTLRRRYLTSIGLAVMIVAMTASGFAQWANVAVGPMTAVHAATSFGVFVLTGWHVWTRRRVLRTRVRGHGPVPGTGAVA